MSESKRISTSMFTRFWVLCLMDGATKVGLAPAGRPQIFALAYFANAVASAFHADAIQRAVLRNESGPILADVAIELDRLAGLGLCDVTRVVGIRKSAVLKSQYYASLSGMTHLDNMCRQSAYFQSVREFHRLVAEGFSDLGVPSIVEGSIAEASYSDISVGEGELVNLGEFEGAFPTLKAIATVRAALPPFRDKSAYSVIQVYGRYLSSLSPASAAVSKQVHGVGL